MAGLVPAIHAFLGSAAARKDVDARDKRGHDEWRGDMIQSRPNTL
jgi:hypothetical protein